MPATRHRRRTFMLVLATVYVVALVAVGTRASFRQLPAEQPAGVASLAAAR
jgi:hypothetical protein